MASWRKECAQKSDTSPSNKYNRPYLLQKKHPMLTTQSIPFLQGALPDLQAIHLFGSQASGHATTQSDVDLAVLLPLPLPHETLWLLTADIARQMGNKVDMVGLHQASTVMRYKVITTGKRLWVRTPGLDANHV